MSDPAITPEALGRFLLKHPHAGDGDMATPLRVKWYESLARDVLDFLAAPSLAAEVERLAGEVERLNNEDDDEQLLLESIVKRLADENERLLAALRRKCRCGDDSVPTAWAGPEKGQRIPHHCDCVLYGIELPDPVRTPIAFADAVQTAAALPDERDE